MSKFRHMLAPLVVLSLVVIAGQVWAQKQGTVRGTVVTVAEDRVVVQSEKQGQMTLEVRKVQDGEAWVKDRSQMAQLKTIEKGQTIIARWGQDHTGHYFIVTLNAAPDVRQGILQGQVITAGEGRVVIAPEDGGQMTLEPHWIRRRGKYEPDPYQKVFTDKLKPGDQIVAIWDLDEGTHFVTRGMAVTGDRGLALSLALTQAQLREVYNQVNQLQNEINNLRNLLNRRLPKQED